MAQDIENTFNFVRTMSMFDNTPIQDGSYSSNMIFKMYDAEEQVGECAVSIHQEQISEKGPQLYPNSWYKNGKILPILEVDGYSTIGSQRKGYGRLGYQQVYELSVKCGCGGRIITMPTFGAGKFYEKLGMESPQYLVEQKDEAMKKQDELRKSYEEQGYSTEEVRDKIFGLGMGNDSDVLKYFDPTPENLAKLYKGSEDKLKLPNDTKLLSESLQYKEVKVEVIDNSLAPELVFDEQTGEFTAISKIDELKARLHKDDPVPTPEIQSTGTTLKPETIKAYKELKEFKK